MMNTNFVDQIRPFVSKILGPILGAFFTWIATRYGIIIDEDTQTEIIFGVAAAFSGIIAVVINKFINPGNAASAPLAAMEKDQLKVMKQEDAIEKREAKA